jgi:D-glycero-D-manno-heptose 1,7-bisphosphate phosphatase
VTGGRAVFLDRDGVLNRAVARAGRPHPPASTAELRVADGAPEACEALRGAGFALIVVTNQPDVARRTQARAEVDAIHAELCRRVRVDDVYVCPHDDGDACGCRKPAPGMLLAAAERHGLDLATSFMVGDRWRDVEAGRRAGCRTVFIDHGWDERRPDDPDAVVTGVLHAARWILQTLDREGDRTHA